MQQPRDLTLTIMSLRAYAAAKSAVESHDGETELPDTPMIAMVWEILADLSKELKEQRGRS